MYYSRRNMEPVEEHETSVWVCSKESCPCWMREDFSFQDTPSCPVCNSDMVNETKMLPALSNNTFK